MISGHADFSVVEGCILKNDENDVLMTHLPAYMTRNSASS